MFIDDTRPELRGETRPGLKKLFFQDGITDEMVDAAVKMGNALCALGCGKEIATDLTLLTLYDVVLLIADDSGSMKTEEGGKRIETLKIALKFVAAVIKLARNEGIKAIRFLNSKKVWTDVQRKTHKIIEDHPFRHWSRIGTELKNKIINKHVFGSEMKRPLLVITITDGDAEGESKNLLVSVIHECIEKLRDLHKEKTEHGADAIGFQFAKVGNDQGAERLLKRLDDDLKVGDYVDCFPSR
ncbi:hypothetical protein FN846DRAFT_773380 [Sphaerosporella brunnea]|uniref:VWFA domain-containing protein n=1 Tax=Sphaerosporella brunnea TaxID=1250544 RepID=A0A5J5F6Q3_9PEZI|nr:hypothetical protein FN846DRAFT_773380 [Sphaerosporella brunnea]